MCVSLDGYVADPDDGVADVFAWYVGTRSSCAGISGRSFSGSRRRLAKGLLVGGVRLQVEVLREPREQRRPMSREPRVPHVDQSQFRQRE